MIEGFGAAESVQRVATPDLHANGVRDAVGNFSDGRQLQCMPFQSPESTVMVRAVAAPQTAQSIGYGSVSDQFA